MKPTPTPLTRAGPEVLDWEQVDPRDPATGRDPLGLTPADRQALGLTPLKPLELTIPVQGGAETALAEVLADRGAAGVRRERRRSP